MRWPLPAMASGSGPLIVRRAEETVVQDLRFASRSALDQLVVGFVLRCEEQDEVLAGVGLA